jgi:hypothetical protein
LLTSLCCIPLQEPTDIYRKHIAEDLCPYTCPFPECPRAEVLYISRPAWRGHILAAHGAGQYWECLACAGTGTPNTFLTAEEFVSHNRTQHHNTIFEDQVLDLLHSCRKTAPQNISQCPLCPWPRDELMVPDPAASIEHVGNCIHDFSLNALPWAESTDIGIPDSSTPVRLKVQEWFTTMKKETKDVDIQHINVNNFGVLPTAPRPGRQEGVYISEEYFAENSRESSQAERASMPLDPDLPEIRGTYLDDEQDPWISHNSSPEPDDPKNYQQQEEVEREIGSYIQALKDTNGGRTTKNLELPIPDLVIGIDVGMTQTGMYDRNSEIEF